MNYIAEINAFEKWLEGNYLPAASQLLWYKLLMLFNRCGWSEWITVDNQRLMALIQVKRDATFIEQRNKLVEAGLICYQRGKKGSPNRYKLNQLTFTSEVQTEGNSVVETVVQSEGKTVAQTADINKQNVNQTKQEENIPPQSPKGESRFPYGEYRNIFVESCPSLPAPEESGKWTAGRKKALRSRNVSLEEFTALCERIEKSDFLTGRNGRWHGCSLDWVLKPSNWQKIMEGNYDNGRCKPDPPPSGNRTYDIEEYESMDFLSDFTEGP